MLGFRVWDSEKKSFLSHNDGPPVLLQNGEIKIITSMNFSFWCKDMDINRYIPMQATGIKDSDGNEIFEGDILKYLHYGEEIRFYHVKDAHHTIRSFHSLVSLFSQNPENQFSLVMDCAKNLKLHCTIFGNRFENPELLEKI